MTLHAWKEGKELVWDVTVVDTLAPSHLHGSASEAGSAALEAEEKKTEKYSDIAERYNFCPIGMETMGSWGPEARKIIGEIGKKLVSNTNEIRAAAFLKQKISLTLQRGNAISVRGTAPVSLGLHEIFLLLDWKH